MEHLIIAPLFWQPKCELTPIEHSMHIRCLWVLSRYKQLQRLFVNLFQRKTTVSVVAVYTDFRLDESYTPSEIRDKSYKNLLELNIRVREG